MKNFSGEESRTFITVMKHSLSNYVMGDLLLKMIAMKPIF